MVVEGIGEDRKSKKGKCNRTENSENKGEKWMSKEWAKLKAISKSWKSRLGRDEPHVGCGQKEKRLKYVKYPPPIRWMWYYTIFSHSNRTYFR